MKKRYGDLQKGDIIWWYGGKVRITAVRTDGMSSYFPGERVMRFDVEPADEECVKVLGNFYSHGTYGGVEHLEVQLVEEEEGEGK